MWLLGKDHLTEKARSRQRLGRVWGVCVSREHRKAREAQVWEQYVGPIHSLCFRLGWGTRHFLWILRAPFKTTMPNGEFLFNVFKLLKHLKFYKPYHFGERVFNMCAFLYNIPCTKWEERPISWSHSHLKQFYLDITLYFISKELQAYS